MFDEKWADEGRWWMAEPLKGVSTRSGFRNPDGNETKGTSLHISVRHAGKLPPPGCRDVTLIWRKTAKQRQRKDSKNSKKAANSSAAEATGAVQQLC